MPDTEGVRQRNQAGVEDSGAPRGWARGEAQEDADASTFSLTGKEVWDHGHYDDSSLHCVALIETLRTMRFQINVKYTWWLPV